MKNIALLLIALVVTFTAVGQSYTQNNIRSTKIRNSGEVIHNNQVTGYFMFYDLERTNARMNNFMLKVLDENLNEINSVTITRTTGFVVLEASFNGSVFAVLGYDRSKNMVELIAFDEKLKQTASFVRLVKGSNMLNAYGAAANGNETEQNFIVPVTDKGFMLYSVSEDRKAHYQIEFLDNNLKSIWTDRASPEAGYEIGFEAFQDSQAIGSLIERRKKAGSKDVEYDLLVNSAVDGHRLFKVPVVVDKGYTVAVSDIRHDTLSGDYIVFGEFYSPTARETRDRSLGFMSVVYDAEGKLKDQKPSTWAAMSNVTPLDEKGKFDGSNTSILFHNTIRTSDGQVFVIGEQYKKAASAGGIALTVAAIALGGGSANTSVTQINIYNLVVFQFNPDYTINKVHVFDKNKSVMQLPGGALETSPKAVSHYAKSWGAFDYRFTQMSVDNSTFIVTYVDYDRAKQGGNAFVVGSVVYTPEKTFVTDKFNMTKRSSEFNILKAKPGYILISEYFRKEKKIENRLEKVNY
jgi:hypothetical protein